MPALERGHNVYLHNALRPAILSRASHQISINLCLELYLSIIASVKPLPLTVEQAVSVAIHLAGRIPGAEQLQDTAAWLETRAEAYEDAELLSAARRMKSWTVTQLAALADSARLYHSDRWVGSEVPRVRVVQVGLTAGAPRRRYGKVRSRGVSPSEGEPE